MTPHPLDAEGHCALCRSGLSGFDGAFAYGAYDGTLRKLIQVFKYQRIPVLGKPLATLLSNAVPRERAFDVIVPMPMHWRRRWQRGFNQAALLADELGARLGVPVMHSMRRVKATPPQAGLTAAQRRENMSGAFKVSRLSDVQGKRVLLVDDVLTTGATAWACTRSLKRAGAVRVTLATVARADRRPASALNIEFKPTGTSSSTGSVQNGQPRSTA